MATSIRFENEGTTTVVPSGSAQGEYPPGVDVIIGWVSPAEFPAFRQAREAGYGGAQWIPAVTGGEVITHGYALINGDPLAGPRPPEGFTSAAGDGHLLLHELGHMMGLAHVSDPTQIMFAVATPGSPTAYQAGDLAGLRLLGAGGCLTAAR